MSQEFCWLNQSSQPSEENVDNITKKLIQLHRDERIRVLHNLARTRAAFRSNEFFRRYRAPSGTIGQRSKRPSLFRRKEKSKKYKFDEFAFRTPEETLREREKIKAHMKKMIEADLARIKREEAKKLKEEEEKIKQAEKKKKRAELRQKIKSLPNDEYMRRLKKKDKE